MRYKKVSNIKYFPLRGHNGIIYSRMAGNVNTTTLKC